MLATFLTLLLSLAPSPPMSQVSDVQKREFIELLKTLPTKGDFYTDEAVEKAGPYLPILFALTEKEIEKYDIYPFAAISRGLSDRQEHRAYAVRHFAEIRHPALRLFWGVKLFDAGEASPEVVRLLRDALESDVQARQLSDIVGPQFDDFKKRITARPQSP
jgi:hypothetical protein